MKYFFKTVALLSVVIWFSGCIIVSMNPIYESEKELVFDPALLGTWTDSEGNKISFTKSGDKRYTCVFDVGNIPNNFDAYLIQLDKYRFLDLYPGKLEEAKDMNIYYMLHLIPMHSISKVWFENDKLYLSFLNQEWFEKQIEQKKVSLPYAKINDRIVLTASAREIQRFILQYADDTSAFQKPEQGLQRIK
ncbi:MAG: hypothetical protein N3A72_01505 [bacterium]|nr:hypothetical protein [bacterium]